MGRHSVLLEAPPGAGKSTIVPIALLQNPWLEGQKILMLEPRRIAARAVANRMSVLLGESVGRSVGFRTRLETKVSRETRIEVVTEGILTRMLQEDSALAGIGCVIFDEFHERSLNADLGLALCIESQQNLREDLRLLVMSATLDLKPLVRLLGDAPVVSAKGRSFEVRTHYVPRRNEIHLELQVAQLVRSALRDHEGDVLCFLPGAAEIRRVQRNLQEPDLDRNIRVMPLYGELDGAEQDAALAPSAPGQRKVVLATSIAETSLTIEGIRVVVDSGMQRYAEFDPATDARARKLWDAERLTRSYTQTTERIERWLATMELEPRAAAREAFFFGGDVLRKIIFDPRLPEPLVDIAARKQMLEAAARLDTYGRRLWERLVTNQEARRAA